MSQRTPLYPWHVEHGGRIVPFGGWDMPVTYSNIVEEHNAVRTGVGIFDISHMGRLDFHGPDSQNFIQAVWTNNAANLKSGQVRYGLICNKSGGIRDDVLVYQWSDSYSMVVNASNREKILSWLEENKAGRKVQVIDTSAQTAMIAVQGPKAMELCRDLTADDPNRLGNYFATKTTWKGKPCVLSRTGYTGEDGVELTVPAAHGVELWQELIQRGARPCGLGARDTLRLEAAMPLYGHELSEEIDPLQAGLGWAVKLDKGDFLGREALLLRQQDTQRRLRVGLELEGKRIAREGATVLHNGQPIGIVTSGTFSPTFQKALAMAYVDPAHAVIGTPCAVDVRGKGETAHVVALPFYRRTHK